jgi:hypothetical protein
MRKPPGFRGEEVCAEECNQPDKHENSQAHLPDLQGVVEFAHRSPSKLADGSKVYHILDGRFVGGSKIGKLQIASDVGARALVCDPPRYNPLHERPWTRHSLPSPAEEFLLRLRIE